MPAGIKHALAETYEDVLRNHTLQMAAALSYYFVLSLFPSLIFLSATMAYLPVPNLFDQALSMMTRFLPPDSMGLVRRVLSAVALHSLVHCDRVHNLRGGSFVLPCSEY